MRDAGIVNKRIIVKLGTQVVLGEGGGIAEARLNHLVDEIAALRAAGHEVILVSSGAVGLGRPLLNLSADKLALPEKQAAAAVGQPLLMDTYRAACRRHGIQTAQLLVTASDFSDRTRYLALRDTFEALLTLKALPIVNENDSVSTRELVEDTTKSFGDNDKLSALLASKLGADLLVMLTNVDGIYTENPALNPLAERLGRIDSFERLRDVAVQGQSDQGRGGMATKIEAAKIAALSGVQTIVASGFRENVLTDCILTHPDAPPGTLIRAKLSLSGRKRWLGLASGYSGVITVNDGAREALLRRNASLLPSGITAVAGTFKAQQVVSLQDAQGVELGRGLSYFGAEDLRIIQGHQTAAIRGLLGGDVPYDVVIQRDNLVIYEEDPA